MEKIAILAALSFLLSSTVALTSTVAPNASVPVDCAHVNDNAVTPSVPLPKLPISAFKATVKAAIIDKNITVDAAEYVDEDANAAAIVLRQSGQQSTIIMSYPTNEIFYITPQTDPDMLSASPQFCAKANLSTDDNTQLFGMSSSAGAGQPHLFSTSRILNFMNGSEVYKGEFYFHGFAVNLWSSCMYWPELNSNFSIDYYFTAPGWQNPSGLDQVPVRAEIAGTRYYPNGTKWAFQHTYSYVNFEAYVDDPETIFETPPGVYCLFRNPIKQPPQLNRHFYYREEIISPSQTGSVVTENDIWYDYDLQLVRFDQRDAPSGTSNPFLQSNGPFTVIHDYGTGVQYTIAQDLQACSVDPIPAGSRGFDSVHNITRTTLGMRNPMQFFNLDNSTYLYAGQRQARGMVCDVFQTVLTDIPGYLVVIYEVYFLAGGQDITDRGSSSDTPPQAIPFRIMMWADGVLANQYDIHNFDQYSTNADAFNVAVCFTGDQTIDFEIFLHRSSQNQALIGQMAPAIKGMLSMQVSLGAGITPIRVQNMRLHWDQWNIYLQGTLIGAAPSLAKYEPTAGQMMSQGQGKGLPNIGTAADCASQCDNLQEWNCISFDFCQSTQTCTLGKANVGASSLSLLNNSACTHFQRVLGGGSVAEVPITDVWNKLRNNVYQGLVTFAVPLPDRLGNINLNQDTKNMDATQKMTFTAYDITDEVVNQPNRQGYSSDMSQFTSIPGKSGKGYTDSYKGVSVDDCAGYCIGESTYTCQSFHYCWDAGSCFISNLHPDERPDMLVSNTGCDLYIRDYTSNFEQFSGITVLGSSGVIYQNVITASECAKLCVYYKGFHCESFDYCTDISACYLGQSHYYDTPKANIQQAPSCVHFSRNYAADFVVKSQKQVPLKDNRIIVAVTPAQCAKLCVEEGSFQCNSFDYCGNYSECRLSDASLSGTGQITMESTAYCDVYLRQYSSTGASSSAQNGRSKGSSKGYSSGSMAGIGIPMTLIGIGGSIGGYIVYRKRFKG